MGSSSSTIRAGESTARASSNFLRWPAETACAPPINTVDRPFGKLASQPLRPTTANVAVSSSSRQLPRATRRLSRIMVAKMFASSAKKTDSVVKLIFIELSNVDSV